MLEIFEKIERATPAKKIEIMKNHPGLKKILEYAYNPFKKYYMSSDKLRCQGTEYFSNNISMNLTWGIFDALSNRTLSGDDALEKVTDYIISLSYDDAELFKRILNKDLRCGINVKTINKAFPGLIPLTHDGTEKPAVMLLKTFKEEKCKWPCMAAVKKDGVRGRFVNGRLYSRTGHKIIGCEHIENQQKYFPNQLDGELIVPNMSFDELSGLIRNNQSVPDAEYHVFDTPDQYQTKQERYEYLKANFIETKHVKLIDHYPLENTTDLNNLYDFAINQLKEEGLVIYNQDSMYKDKRSYDWMRLVPLQTADCKVVGFFEGNGRLEGSLGGIIVDYKGKEVNVGTGFSDDEREDIWDNQYKYLGDIAECIFKEETKKGSMRQPRFNRWRWDLS